MKIKRHINYLLFCMILCIGTGCKKSAKTNPIVGGDLRVDLLGNMTPQSVEVDKNQFAIIIFAGSDLKYRFDLNRIDANHYFGLLTNAQRTSTAVKVYVTKNTEIVKIE